MSENKRYYWLGKKEASEQDLFFLEALDDNLWEAGDEKNWDTCWYTGMPDEDVFEKLDAGKSINHVPGNNALTIKSNLYETLTNARHRLEGTEMASRFDFFPETFAMPDDYTRFLATARAEEDQLWIKKPKNLSRGRGIDMVRHPTTVPFDSEWIMQRYLGNPHLCKGRKYVLRCYVLVTSVEPLRVYWYQDGFAKLASEPYSADDLSNLYRHLTNPDINEKNEEAEAAVTFISFKKYAEWLQSEGHDDTEFFRQLKELITLTVISAREAMRKRSDDIEADTQGCYELIGLDCMVDDNIKPWIIECNLSPSLSTYADPSAGADDEVDAKRNMVRDMVNLLGLNNPPSYTPLSAEEKALQEYQQKGEFELLFPAADAQTFFPSFPIPRYADIVEAQRISDVVLDESNLALTPQEQSDFAFEDSVALLAQDKQGNAECLMPNEMASWIWLNNAQGLAPSDIVQQIMQTLPPQENDEAAVAVATQVWDVLADWSQANIFARQEISAKSDTSTSTPTQFYLPLSGQYVQINSFCEMATYHLQQQQTLLSSEPPVAGACLFEVDLFAAEYGYSLVYERKNVVDFLRLSRVIPTLITLGMERVAEQQKALLVPGCLLQHRGKNILLVCEVDHLLDTVALQLSQQQGWQARGHYGLLKDNQLSTATLPARNTQLEEMNHSWTVLEENNKGVFSYQAWPAIAAAETCEVDQLVIIKGLAEKEEPPVGYHSEALKALWDVVPSRQIADAAVLAQWLETVGDVHLLTDKDIELPELLAQVQERLATDG